VTGHGAAPLGIVHVGLLEEDSAEARALLERWPNPDDPPRRRSRLARALLRVLLGGATGVDPGLWEFSADPSGRPLARAPGVAEPPSVSLSHSGGWVACAVAAGGSLGIDVEAHRAGRDHAGIAGLAFGPGEQRRAADGGAAAFYRIWTLREAMAKSTGQGLVQAADGSDRAAGGPDHGCWTMDLDGARWWLAHEVPAPGLSLSVALEGRAGGGSRWRLSWWRPVANVGCHGEWCNLGLSDRSDHPIAGEDP